MIFMFHYRLIEVCTSIFMWHYKCVEVCTTISLLQGSDKLTPKICAKLFEKHPCIGLWLCGLYNHIFQQQLGKNVIKTGKACNSKLAVKLLKRMSPRTWPKQLCCLLSTKKLDGCAVHQ